MYDAWTHPRTLSIISKIAGIDLIPVIDFEIGNINVSINDDEVSKRNVDNANDDVPVTKWHHDSYPFVCVVMMSDATNMVGGETAMKTGSGEVMKVRGPQMVCVPTPDDASHYPNRSTGLCCCSPRKMHIASSACGFGWERAYYNGDTLSTS